MRSRERLRRCYYYEELDRPAVYIRTYYPDNDPTYDKIKAMMKSVGDLKHLWTPPRPESRYASDQYVEPHTDDFERHTTIVHTPAGDLRMSSFVSCKGQPGRHEQHLLKTPEDVEKYLSLPMPEIECDLSEFWAAERQMGDRGITQVELGLNPAGFVAELFGSETFAIFSVQNRDLINQLCKRQMKIILARLRFLLENKVGPYFGMAGEEYVAPPIHGPRDFYDFNVKYDKPIVDLIHESGGRAHIHCHGSIKNVFQGFIDLGADVLHPFEAPPMGNITVAQAKDLARGSLCLEGNIQIAAMYEKTPNEIHLETEDIIRDAFDDRRGLIVCPTASPYIVGKGEECFQRCKAMVDAVLSWRAGD